MFFLNKVQNVVVILQFYSALQYKPNHVSYTQNKILKFTNTQLK